MSERDGLSTGQAVVAFLSGAAIGSVVTLLTAPTSGREARERIAGAVKTTRDEMGRIPPALRDAYSKASEAAKEAFMETYNKEAEKKGLDSSDEI